MPLLSRFLELPYSAEDIFNLIVNVEEYPLFLPFCKKVDIVEQTEELLIADTHIEYKLISGCWRSVVQKRKPTEIIIKQSGDIFSVFDSKWILTEKKDESSLSCKIEFNIQIEATSKILNTIISPIVETIADMIMNAFSNRARELYG